jgi:hypothetical protein
MQSPKRDQARVIARVTNDVAATPRATLKDGLVQHQWGVGLGSRMPRDFTAATEGRRTRATSFSSDVSRRVACAAEGGHDL